MSRKRSLLDAEISGSATNIYENYEYYRPGCYFTPQIVRPATPYTCTYMQQWYPYCPPATYVVDEYGRIYYLSDFEHQLHVPCPPLPPLQTEIVYHYYKIDDGNIENRIVTVEEDDEDAVSPRKRGRYDDFDDIEPGEDIANALKNPRTINTTDNNRGRISGGNPNIYRVKEGYIVEEPAENDEK